MNRRCGVPTRLVILRRTCATLVPHRPEFAASMKYLTYLKDPYKVRMIASFLLKDLRYLARWYIGYNYTDTSNTLIETGRFLVRTSFIEPLFHPFDPSQQFNDRRTKSGMALEWI